MEPDHHNLLQVLDNDHFPRELHERIAARREAMVRVLQDLSRQQDRVLFEGRWLTKAEVRDVYRAMKRRDRRILFEVVTLFALLLGATGLVALILKMFVGPG